MAFCYELIKGTCENMCPKNEMKMLVSDLLICESNRSIQPVHLELLLFLRREDEGLLHSFEVIKGSENARYPKADPERTVKKYSRSAAGQPMPKPSDLRTPSALKNTIFYLLNDVVIIESCNWCSVYDFIFDRLCAVRQDVVIQDLNVEHSIEIIKPIVRFLAYSGYRMCEESIQRYDPAINLHHFTECLRKLLSLYENYERQSTENGNNSVCDCERSQFEALYLITFLGNVDAITRGLKLNKELRTPTVDIALQLSIAFYGGNYIRVCRMLKDLPPLLLCAAALHLPVIRRNALFVMNVAFSCRNLQYPAISLKCDLLYEDENKVIDDCMYYGIKVKDKDIVFQKGIFKDHVSVNSLQQHTFITEALEKCLIPDLLNKCPHECKLRKSYLLQ